MTANTLTLEDRVVELMTRLNRKFKVDKALLFGSTASGSRLSDSDVDIIVISRNFKAVPIPERQARIQKEWGGEEEVQALAYTPEEFSRVSDRLTMRDILSYAKDVSPSKENSWPRCGRGVPFRTRP